MQQLQAAVLQGSEFIYEVETEAQGKERFSPSLFKTDKVLCTHFRFIEIKCPHHFGEADTV